MSTHIGVGFLGAGPVTQAIHLPTLAKLPEFRVVSVMDVNPELAATVADGVGARATTSADEVIADPDVDVVVIGSPNQFHVPQAIAACHAGKRAILCEKPIATTFDEAEELRAVLHGCDTAFVVGAMHVHDPGWLAVRDDARRALADWHTARYCVTLPPNPRFEDHAATVARFPGRAGGAQTPLEALLGLIGGSVMGLTSHDLPLVRDLTPGWEEVEVLAVETVASGGYLIHLRIGDRHLTMEGMYTSEGEPDWTLALHSDDAALELRFPPSYVHGGSTVATLTTPDGVTTHGPFRDNGYLGEWRHLRRVLAGEEERQSPDVLVDDVRFIIRIAELSMQLARTNFERA